MSRKSEFRTGRKAGHTREKSGGLRYAARATANWVEKQPDPAPPADTQSRPVYASPGRGANGESAT